MTQWHRITFFCLPLFLIGCGTTLKSPSDTETGPARQAKNSGKVPYLPPAGSGRGKYYLDDGPGENIPDGLLDLPDPEPQIEPYVNRANKPYVVFGKTYTPFVDDRPWKQRGIGSWYGRKFHGQKTSSGEPYDMYKITAAHPTLPIPSYARITNLANGKQIIVRVNDRGPFHSDRIIDLSFTAALKLGYLGKGSGELEVERILPDEIMRMAKARQNGDTRPAVQLVKAESVPAPAGTVTAAAGVTVLPVSPLNDSTIVTTSLPPAPVAQDIRPAVVSATQVAQGNPVATGYYVQLGAFAQAANAEAMRARLMQNWSGTYPGIEVVAQGTLFRLHSGPFATRAEAAAAALTLRESAGAKPMIVQK